MDFHYLESALNLNWVIAYANDDHSIDDEEDEMNRSKIKRRHTGSVNSKKVKASINELSWLDKHEDKMIYPVVAPIWSHNATISHSPLKRVWKNDAAHQHRRSISMKQSPVKLHVIHEEPDDTTTMETESLPRGWVELQDTIQEQVDAPSKDPTLMHNLSEMLPQYGSIDFHIQPHEATVEVMLTFAHSYANEQYALIVTSHHRDYYVAIKYKWRNAALIDVVRIKSSEQTAGSLDWIAFGDK